jgi:hypothetical protein
VVAYDSGGNRLWTSAGVLDEYAYSSAPVVSPSGSVVTADQTKIVRFSNQGTLVWATSTPGGYPISPVMTKSGQIVVATRGGPVSVYDPQAGSLLAYAYMGLQSAGGSYYETVNTPCVIGNRVYISTQLVTDSSYGRLYALDVDVTNLSQPLTVAWTWDFGGPSGASPTCTTQKTIVFDGASQTPGSSASPVLFSVHDGGTAPSLAWSTAMAATVPASVAHDPRGGFWVICTECEWVERLDEDTGAVLERFRPTDLIADGNNYVPSSALTMSGTKQAPTLTLGTMQAGVEAPGYVLGVDLLTHSLLWKVSLDPGDRTAGQFPILYDSQERAVVVFSGFYSGAYFVGLP